MKTLQHQHSGIILLASIYLNPTSPLGDRWFRACVSASIPPTPTSNAFVLYQSLQLLHPILCTVLEEGFSPPPPSSPGLWTVVSRGVVATYIRLFRHPGHHHFFIIFSTPFYIDFYSISTPNLEKKSIKNRSQERLGKLPTFCIDFSSNLNGFKGCWNLVFELLASTGSKISTFWLSAFMLIFGSMLAPFLDGFSLDFPSKIVSRWC